MVFLITLLFSTPLWAVNLDQAIESSFQKNETVGQSKAQVQQAEELYKQAKGAVLPTLTLNGTYLIQPKSSDPLAAQFFPEQQKTANLSLTQPLFRGLREFAGLRRQDHFYSSQKQSAILKLVRLYEDVSTSYLEVLSLEQDIRNIEAQQKIYQARIKDLQARAHRGESSSTETLTAQSTAAALDAEFQIQSSKLRSARQNFSFLTGLPLDATLTEIPEATSVESLKPLADYLARVDARPDVVLQKEELEISDEDIAIAKGAHWPTLDVTGNYYLVKPDGLGNDIKWDVQFKAVFPLYEGGVTQSRVRSAAAKYGESQLLLEQTRRKAQTEINSLYDSLKMRVDQMKYLKQSSDLSEKNAQVLARDSKRGLVRSIDVQLGLTEYRLAKRNYDQARYQAKLEKIRLELAAANFPSSLVKGLE